MKIVEQSAALLWVTPEPENAIERAARVCYKSEDKIGEGTAEKMIRMLIEKGHEAMLEHASASILFVTDRGISHELVRHRLASYAQESTRYCNYSKEKFGREITVVKPPLPDGCGNPSSDLPHTCPVCANIGFSEDAWVLSVRAAEIAYFELLDRGCKPQIARSVLPTCLKTEIVCTANLREWRHIFRLRLSPAAHPQMRELMGLALALLRPLAPTVFEEFVPT